MHGKTARAPEPFKDGEIAGPPAAKSMVVADKQFAHSEPFDQHETDELFSLIRGQFTRKGDDRHFIEAGRHKHFRFFITNAEQRRSRCGMYHGERVRRKRDEDRAELAVARRRGKPIEHQPMPAMYAVE